MRRHVYVFGRLLLTVFLLNTPWAAAVELKDIYSADVGIKNQSSSLHREAFARALGRVLVKMSGVKDIGEAAEAEAIIKKASRYVRRYQYIQKPVEPVNKSILDAAQKLHIRVEFDGQALETELRNAGLPVWSVNRPAAIVWLAVQQQGKRYIVGDDSVDRIKNLIGVAAQRRGVPLIFPLLDLEDTRRVDFGDIRAGFSETLVSASQRYNAPIVLVGFLKFNREAKATVKWSVYRDTASSSWQKTQVGLAEAADSGIDGLADILASRYAFTAGDANQIFQYVVSVKNIISLDDYAATLSYLENLTFVEKVTPVRVETGQVHYLVWMRGELNALQRSLTLSDQLQPTSPVVLPSLNKRPTGTAVQSVRERVDLYYSLRVTD